MTAPDLATADQLNEFASQFERDEDRVSAFAPEPERRRRWESERERALAEEGPLRGVLLGVKDIFHVDGLPTRAGSALPPEALTGPEGPAVARLRRAGAFVVGKTATTEFAYFAPAPTRNPHALDHTPGGSSSGSAAAVATGQCRLALGTQTIGSIGRPAAFCGVVGYKPSYDRVERDGVIPLAPSLDHVGLFAPDLDGAERGATVLVPDWRAVPEAPHRPLRLGVPTGPYLDRCDPGGRTAFDETVARLAGVGHDVLYVEAFPDFAEVETRHRRLLAAEAAEVHAGWIDAYGDLYRPATRELIEKGRRVPPATADRDREARLSLRRHLESLAADRGIDVWLSPPAPGVAPAGLASTGDPVLNLPWTQAGLPTLVVPTGHIGALPVGLQMAGSFGRDEELFAAARRLVADLEHPE